MVNVMKGLMILTLAFCAAVVFGCGTMHTRSESKIVPITTFTQVAGKWEGLSKRMPRNDYLRSTSAGHDRVLPASDR